MNFTIFYGIPIVILIKYIAAITVEDAYERLLEKERNAEDTFSSQFIRPLGAINGELIWPRSYSKSSYLLFDNNGVAYNVAATRPSLSEILSRTFSNFMPKAAEHVARI